MKRLAAIACIALLGTAADPAAPDAIVAGAVRTLETQRHGIIAFAQHYTYEEHGPGHNTSRQVDDRRLSENGRLVAVHIVREASNGQPESTEQVAKDQAADDRQLPEEDYRLPVGREALAEYRFSPAACSQCGPDQRAIAFTSIQRDDQHGDGTMIVDVAARHIVQLSFAPSVMPAHVDSASIVVRFGQVLPDLWDVVEYRGRYNGHMLFIHGWAQVVRVYSDYRRFATLDQGLAAIRG